MILYRFSPQRYSHLINGEGSRLYGGRWNSIGFPVVYCSCSISLSLLELLIHSISYNEIQNNRLTIIEVASKSILELDSLQLKASSQHDISYCRYIGDEFLKQQSSLLLKVPSVIIPEEYNILINPKHKDFNKVSVQEIKSFSFDMRLFKR